MNWIKYFCTLKKRMERVRYRKGKSEREREREREERDVRIGYR